MLTKEHILKVLREELPVVAERFGVHRLALFGSYIRGEQRSGSDIDILVEFSTPVGFFKFIELEDYLTERLGSKVDLVTPGALKPLMKVDILESALYA